MSVKPIDFQVNIPKTVEVSKLQNDALQRSLSQHQQQATTVQQGIEHNLHQVYSQGDPQKTGIHQREEKNRGKQQEEDKERKQGRNKTIKDGKKPGIKLSTIDIRL